MKRLCSTLAAVSALAGLLTGSAFAAPTFTAPAPEDLIIYHLMIDRFDDGDPTNNRANPRATFNPSSGTAFHGGDLEGVRRRLGYIKGLGANGIWLSPLLENVSDYHGYGTYDWYNVEPNFGTKEKLVELVNEANAMGIAVYLDMVAGHCGNIIDSADAGFPGYRPPPNQYNLRWRSSLRYPPPFNSLTYFHAHGNIGTFDVIPEQEIGELVGLDDLKTETADVQELMGDIWKYWMREVPISGFRVDTVKHIDRGFWNAFLPNLAAEAQVLGRENYFTFGEVYGANDDYMALYVGDLDGAPYRFDAALDFQFYYATGGVFATANRPPVDVVNRMLARADRLGAHHYKMPNFIDNHDVRRFLSTAADNPGSGDAERLRRLELAMIFMFTVPGPPVVYYGTEQGFSGGNDPNNREDMFDGSFESGPSLGDNFDESSTLYRLVARLSEFRSGLTALRRGQFVPVQAEESGPGILAYLRRTGEQTVLVVMNTATGERTLAQRTVSDFAGATLVNALNPTETIVVDSTGTLPARSIPGQGAAIWVLDGAVPPPHPDVSQFTPADGADGVAVNLAEARVDFLVPMDPTVTAAAISIAPPVSFAVRWENENRTAVLELAGPLASRTGYTVTVAANAASAEGAEMGRAASATWTTERVLGELPALGPPVAVPIFTGVITIDGSAADWPVPPIQSTDTAAVEEGVYTWRDAVGDDVGDGNYTYPSNSAFDGGEADFSRLRLAWDGELLYIMIQPAGINASATFFTPYYGLAMNTAPGGYTGALGIDQEADSRGIADLAVRPDMAPEWEVTFTGPRGVRLHGVNGLLDSGFFVNSAYSQQTGIVEISIPWWLLGGRPANLDVIGYTGLESFGGMREVIATRGQWDPGGGISGVTDPDVFDLVGASRANQTIDLSGYDASFTSTVLHSVLRLSLVSPGVNQGESWVLF